MLARMPARLMQEWMVFAEQEPLGFGRTDALLAQLNATMVNVHRDPKKTNALTAADFLHPQRKAQKQSASWAWAKTWALAHNAAQRRTG